MCAATMAASRPVNPWTTSRETHGKITLHSLHRARTRKSVVMSDPWSLSTPAIRLLDRNRRGALRFGARQRRCRAPREAAEAYIIQIVSQNVVYDDEGKVLDDEVVDSFRAEVGESHYLRGFHALPKQRSRTLDGTKVDAAVPEDGLPHLGAPPSLADHAFHSLREDDRCKGIHARCRCRPGGAYRPPGAGRRRPAVVNHSTTKPEWHLLSLTKQLGQSFVCGVTRSVDGTGEQHEISYLQPRHVFVRKRCFQPDRGGHSDTLDHNGLCAMGVAVQVDGNGQAGDVGRVTLYVYGGRRNPSPVTPGAASETVVIG